MNQIDSKEVYEMLTMQGTAQKVFAFRPSGRLSSVNLWGWTQLGVKPISYFTTETWIFGFWVPHLSNNSCFTQLL